MKDSELTMGSFCTGIGGLDLGLHWAFPNATTLWQVEYEPWPRKVLEKHFPSADRSKTDVRELHGADLEPVDILSMGFPCQSISVSSKQEGFNGKSGLWFECIRVVREMPVKPKWLVLENVSAITSIDNGKVLARVCRDLAEAGYNHIEYTRIGAGGKGGVGAPHRRWRFFAVCRLADTDSHTTPMRGERAPVPQASLGGGTLRGGCDSDAQRQESVRGTGQVESVPVADTMCVRPSGQGQQDEPSSPAATPHREAGFTFDDSKRHFWRTESRESWVAHGLSSKLDRHNNREALKALGNAVVPQCAYYVGLRMIAIEEQLNNEQTLKEV